MVSLAALWLPITLSAVIVFVVSSLIHLAVGYHSSDFQRAPEEDRVMAVLRDARISPGEYVMPHAPNMTAAGTPEFREKSVQGPRGILTIMKSGPPTMGPQLALWFVYLLVVGLFVAYLSGFVVAPGAEYMTVFRVTSTAAFMAYGIGLWQGSIWYGRKWSTTLKNTFDALIYALFTAGTFAWLWPG